MRYTWIVLYIDYLIILSSENSEIYDLYSNILNKDEMQYKDSKIIIESNFKKNYSKKKVLKNTNGKYKTSKGYAKKSMFKHQ